MSQKHIPTRMCTVCRVRMPKFILQRYTLSLKNDTAYLDKKQCSPGRGLYLCAKEYCQKKFKGLYH